MAVKKITVEVEYEVGDAVEYNSKMGKDEGRVYGIEIKQTGIRYGVMWSDKREGWHYNFELKSKS